MTKPKWTPGPWWVECHNGEHKVLIELNFGVVFLLPGPAGTEEKYNARLMAAGPEMAAELREFTKWVDGLPASTLFRIQGLHKRDRSVRAILDKIGGGDE